MNIPGGTPSKLEEALGQRAIDLSRREAALRAREEALRSSEQWQKELAAHNDEMREVNAQLVITSLSASDSKDAAEQAQQRLVEFVAMLAHELRNPLAPIRGAVALLARMDSAEASLRPIRYLIERQVAQMGRLLDDLLDVSRMTSGKVALQREPACVSAFVEQAIETCDELFKLQKQHLTVDMPAAPLWVNGDPARLTQIIGNLLHNAAKYTPEGGSVALNVRRHADRVVIKVTDSGIGISAATLPLVFELFSQDARSLSRSQGGLGIGLTVVRTMVELHGGTVEARSEGPGQGSEFIVTLPFLDYVAAPAATEPVAALSAQAARILIIDDNIDAGIVLEMLLSMSGHEVTTAVDGQSGLRSFGEFKPNVVLCDIGLPGIDGYELAKRMRNEKESGPRPLLVAITGYGAREDHDRALAAGFDHHLVKPVDPDALLRLIDSELLAALKPAASRDAAAAAFANGRSV